MSKSALEHRESHNSSDRSTRGKDGNASNTTSFSNTFFAKDAKTTAMRSAFLKITIGGLIMATIVIFAIFSIYWGALWKTPSNTHKLKGWIVDFDGGQIGHTVTQAFTSINSPYEMTWEAHPASAFPGGVDDLANAVIEEKCWAAIAINTGATSRLNAAVASADSSYNGSLAVTAFGDEARNELGYRIIIKPLIDAPMQQVAQRFALQFATTLSTNPNASEILASAPQIVTQPVYYTVDNLRPFDVPVASAVDFVGLIYMVILTFVITMVGYNARLLSGISNHLSLRSLIQLRLVVPAVSYFFLSLFYSLLSLAFQVPFNRKFGSAGFVVYWMLSWVGMLCLGLALESMITILTPKFVPVFLILWIISNVSVCFFPLTVLPGLYKYGYGAPMFNISQGVRTILFGTKNSLGLNFGVLIVWVAISCITLPLFQWLVWRQDVHEWQRSQNNENENENGASEKGKS